MKGIEVEPEIDLQIDLNVTSYIPDQYISDANQKIEIYQDIALCKNEKDIQNVIDEIIDRFGNMPPEVENLIEIARIKYMAKSLNISKIASKKANKGEYTESIIFTFEQRKFNIDINQIVKKYGNRIKFSNGIKPMITLKATSTGEKQILQEVRVFLGQVQVYPK